jgi:hypothetical protein
MTREGPERDHAGLIISEPFLNIDNHALSIARSANRDQIPAVLFGLFACVDQTSDLGA